MDLLKGGSKKKWMDRQTEVITISLTIFEKSVEKIFYPTYMYIIHVGLLG